MSKKKSFRDTDASFSNTRQQMLHKVLTDLNRIASGLPILTYEEPMRSLNGYAHDLAEHTQALSVSLTPTSTEYADIAKLRAEFQQNIKKYEQVLSQLKKIREHFSSEDNTSTGFEKFRSAVCTSLKKICIKLEYACQKFASFLEKITLPKSREHDSLLFDLRSFRDRISTEVDEINRIQNKKYGLSDDKPSI